MEAAPPEIHTIIFAHLTEHDWIQSIHVCRAWRALVPPAVAHLWHHLDVDFYTVDYIDSLQHFPSVQSLKLLSATDLDKLPAGQITRLELADERITSIPRLRNITQPHLDHLESLRLHDCGLSPADIVNMLSTCPALTHLLLSNDWDENNLWSTIERDFGLVSLELSINNDSGPWLQPKPILIRCPQLRVLKFDTPYIVNPPTTSQEILEMCPKLDHLFFRNEFRPFHCDASMTYLDINVEPAGDTRHGLRGLYLDELDMNQNMSKHLISTVRELDISSRRLPDISLGSKSLRAIGCPLGSAIDLATLFRNSPNLEELHLYYHELNEEHVAPTVLEASRCLSRLSVITLAGCRSSDILARFLEPFEATLRIFGLGSWNMPDLGVLSRFKSLERLDIDDDLLRDTPMSQRLPCLPGLKHLTVTWYPGEYNSLSLSGFDQLESIRLVCDMTLESDDIEELAEFVDNIPGLKQLIIEFVASSRTEFTKIAELCIARAIRYRINPLM